ncbi:DUF4430 domain-containing protein [Olsenella porci]|uniref:DUF4430 domain-containing protein n=1 Tax=Olsenella porci TaxID=2652279 RepID=A0A6N7XEA5_9ACTN|nr:DUF4430 domain-containing protein [Olsenella porci]MST72653.1 DUF4430 domain-containing protein [Olsenella porci]
MLPKQCTTASRALAIILSAAMAFGGVPTRALAEIADELSTQDGATEASQSSDAGSSAGSTVQPTTGETGETAPTDGGTATAGAAGASEGPSTTAAQDASSDSKSSEPAASARATALDSQACVSIQDQKDKGGAADEAYGDQAVGTTLWANVYDWVEDEDYGDGDYETWANDGSASYQWLECDTASTDVSSYAPIAGQTSQSITLTSDLAGKYLAARVTVGSSTLWAPSAGGSIQAQRLPHVSAASTPGEGGKSTPVDIYSATTSLSQDGSSTSLYGEGDTLWAQGRVKDGSTYVLADPSLLAFQWQVSSDNSTWEDIAGATSQSLSLAGYAGRYVRCKVSDVAGTSTKVTRSRNPVTAAGAVAVTSVSLDRTGQVQPGETVTATAKASGTDVSDSQGVAWSWYVTSSPYAYGGTKIEGATGRTFQIPASDDSFLGKYVYAVADGGTGGVSSTTAAGPVREAGSVWLHHVSVSGSAKIGSTLTATAYKSSYATVASGDKVTYQWQYSRTKTTSDYAFSDIPGATSQTYTVPQSITVGGQTVSLVGCYLRVRAVSDGSVVSTSVKGYYGTTAVDPVGPVSPDGGYDLSSVALSSSDVNAKVGDTITPQARYEVQGTYSSYETDVPSDARLTYTWYASDADGSNQRALTPSDGVREDGALVPTAALSGKLVWVTASALMSPATSEKVRVSPKGEYKLDRVTLSHSGTAVLTGDVVSASAYALDLAGSRKEVTGREGVSLQWYVADSEDAPADQWTPLKGQTSATLVVPAEAAGKWVAVVATSGTSSASATLSSKAVSASSLEGAAAILANEGTSGWKPNPTYGIDTNVDDMLLAELAATGFDTTGLSVRLVSATFSSTNPNATVGLSTSSESNGTITYYSGDPDVVGRYAYNLLHTVDSATFELTRGGETATYTTGSFGIPWDLSAARALLEEKAEQLSVGFADGDDASGVTGTLTLPYKAGENGSASWTNVEWTSDDSAVTVDGYGWDDYAGKVTRGSSDKAVTLTAKVSGLENYGLPADVSVERAFKVTVKADPEKVQEEREQLQQAVDRFSYDTVTYATGDAIASDGTGLSQDLQLPTTRTLGVDGKYYKVTYTASSDQIVPNGYAASVVRGLPGSDSGNVSVTCTITSKANPEITASKTLDFTVAPLASSDVDDALALMARVKAAYKDALLNGQAEPVSQNLSTFYGAYLDDDGNLVWARSSAEMASHEGIVLEELPGYDSMGSADQARTFKPSDTSLLENEDLKLAWNVDPSDYLGRHHDQPTYNKSVTVTSVVSDSRYKALAERYADDPTWGAKLSQLVNQTVSATVSVAGTTGEDEPVPTAKVTATVIGRDAFGKPEVWASTATYNVEQGTSAATLSERLFSASGLTVSSSQTQYGYYLQSISSPSTGTPYGYDAATGRYWQLFVNGKASDVGADGVSLSDGDSVTWYYSSWGEALPSQDEDNVTATVRIVGPNAAGDPVNWVPSTEVSVPEGTTAAQLTKTILERSGMTCDDGMYTISAAGGSTLPNGGTSLSYSQDGQGKWSWWQFYVNGTLADTMAANYVVKPGDSITWSFGTMGSSVPSGDVQVYPDAKLPGWSSEWPGYKGAGQAGTTSANTPTTGSKLAWQQSLIGSSMMTLMSDPILVNGDVYVAAGSKLQVRDASTGELRSTADLAANVESTCRLVYADGLVIVPLHGGRLQALAADSLKTVWVTDALPDSVTAAGDGVAQQPISTLTVSGGYVYFGTAAATFSGGTVGGYLGCVNVRTGAVRWMAGNSGTGYYWSGVAVSGGSALVADDSGTLWLRDSSTGEVRASLSLGTGSRAGVVTSADGATAYVVTTDGVLHRVAVGQDGTLAETGSIRFCDYSTSTPTLVDGRIYVGGGNGPQSSRTGGMYVIDASTLRVVASATKLGTGATMSGDSKSAPLVSTTADGTYVYFTCNGKPGGVYVYKVGDSAASLLYLPDQERQQYTMSSVVAAADGSLYYTNDSGYLFKILTGSTLPEQPEPQAPPKPSGGGSTSGGTTGGSTSPKASGSTKGTAPGTSGASASRDTAGISARSGVPTTSTQVQGRALSLLDGVESSTLAGEQRITTTVTDKPASQGSDNESASPARTLPIWPIVGMALGAIALVLALLARRRNGRED